MPEVAEPTVQESLTKMNESGGEIVFKPAGSPRTETPPPATQPPTNLPPAPATEGSAPNSSPAAQPPVSGTPPAPVAPPAEIPEESIFASLSKLTGGAIKDKGSLEGLVKGYTELQKQAEEGFKPKFTSERAKWAHELLSQSPENEMQSAMRTIRALSYNPEGKDKKDTLFEAFLLDPSNSDLSPSQANEIFNAEFEQKYGDMEGNVLRTRQFEQEHKKALADILSIQNGFKATEEAPRAVAKEVETSVANAVNGFKGFKVSFSENAPETEILNVAIDNPQKLQSLQEAILNPDNAYNELISQFETDKGFDYQALVQEIYERNNHKEIRAMAFEQGQKLGILAERNRIANASNPKNPSDLGAPTIPGGKLTLEQSWQNAQK